MTKSNKNRVTDFLKDSSKHHRGGVKCTICALENVADIDEACLLFNKERMKGNTSASWSSFTRHVLSQDPFNVPVKVASIRNHLENHRNVEIA